MEHAVFAVIAPLRSPAPQVSREALATGPDPWATATCDGGFGLVEAEFIAARDSVYLATRGADGWPVVQHRAGPLGFIEIVDAQTLSFPDYGGRQPDVSHRNLSEDPRVCISMMDYESGARLNVFGRAVLVAAHAQPLGGGKPLAGEDDERHWRIRLEGFDWTHRQFVPRRFSEDRVRGALGSLQDRIRALKRQVARLERAQ